MPAEQCDGLLAAGDDGGERRDQAEGEEVVGGAREVAGGREGGGEVGGEGGGEGVEGVEAVGEGQEGDGEVDCCWVDWFAGSAGRGVLVV